MLMEQYFIPIILGKILIMLALVFEVWPYSTYTYEYKLNNITLINYKKYIIFVKNVSI
ncbi:hypothetical protein UT300006_23840 [Clostridium sp. CTA-6]|nr:hypothetical protein CLOSPO_00318 [Clostridium sporogenes ATCC 15579]